MPVVYNPYLGAAVMCERCGEQTKLYANDEPHYCACSCPVCWETWQRASWEETKICPDCRDDDDKDAGGEQFPFAASYTFDGSSLRREK